MRGGLPRALRCGGVSQACPGQRCDDAIPVSCSRCSTRQGSPTGVAKARAAVHRDGDWHLAFFCWIVRRGREVIEVVLQRRAATKDVWPGRFDASAAGHVRFGETTAEAAREIDEELGLAGRRRRARASSGVIGRSTSTTSGLVDREIHDVHLLRCDRPLEDYRPGPEVSGIVSVPLDALVELVTGERASLATTLVTFDATARAPREPIDLRQRDLVPYDAAYWEAIRALPPTRGARRSRGGSARDARCREGSRRPPRARGRSCGHRRRGRAGAASGCATARTRGAAR